MRRTDTKIRILLPGSHSVRSLGGVSAASRPPAKGRLMTGNLEVVVGVDLECALMRIGVSGLVTDSNLRALYAVIRRANSAVPGIDLILDLTAALIEPAALEQLRSCEAAHRLPAEMDPGQQDMHLKVLPESGHGTDQMALELAA